MVTLIDILKPALVALLISLIATPLTIKFAKKYGIVVDSAKKPHPAHLHQGIVPKAGGIPIFLSLALPILFFVPLDKHIIGILIGCFLLLGISLVDDIAKDLSPYPRLLFQILAAAAVVASGVGITFITNPLGGILHLDLIIIPINFLGTHNIIVIADILAFFWIVWMMNMINWSGGVDGQMAGIVIVAAITIGSLALNQFNLGDPNQLPLAIISFIVAGSAAGFLVFNWHPAKIFAGDGAIIFGFMIAVLCILSSAKLATALLVLLVPAIDFFYTFFRRILSGKSPLKADRKHLHHLLLDRGWSQKQISLFYILSCATLGLAATRLSSQGKLFVVISVGVVTLGVIVWLHLLERKLFEEKKT